MASQLFYTYDGTPTGVQSTLFSGTNNFTYSLVFDQKRKTVWAQGVEYGIAQVKDNNQTWKGYNNVEYSLYVDEYGKLVVEGFDPVKITSFNIYSASGDSSTNNVYEVGQNISSENYINNFKINLTGTSIDKGTLSALSIKSSVNITNNTGNAYPTTTGTSITPSTVANTNIYTHNNTGASNAYAVYTNNTHGGKITATVTVKDAKNNTDTKTITVATFKDRIYWFVHDDGIDTTFDTYTEISGYSGFNSAWRGNLGSSSNKQTVPATTTSQYYWLLHPASAGTAVLWTDMGEMEWASGYPHTISFTNAQNYTQNYKLYRSNKPNIGGLNYWVTGINS